MVSNPLISDDPKYDVNSNIYGGTRFADSSRRPTSVYPNRYRGYGFNGLQEGEADPDVIALYKAFLDHRGEWSWEQRRPYVDAAVRLFGSLQDFLLLQLKNPELCKQRRLFVLETARFLTTGLRHVSIYSNTSLFNYEQVTAVADTMVQEINREAEKLIVLGLSKGVVSIGHWLAKPHGFNDMVCTMATFFGPRGPVVG